MGLINQVMSLVFGGGNSVAQVAGIFNENSENAAVRAATGRAAALGQFAAEFAHPRKGLFDRFIDGVNRLPRPMLALGTIGLFVTAMMEPDWFASRMTGIALIPEPLWWLMGAIVSFYFGSRHQAKGQDFQRSVVQTLALHDAKADDEPVAPDAPKVVAPRPAAAPNAVDNAALTDWWATHAG